MRISDISIEDQEKMQGIYNSDKAFNYKGITELFKVKYPDITESIVSRLVRERNRHGEPYVGMRDKVTNPLEVIDTRINTQRQRRDSGNELDNPL